MQPIFRRRHVLTSIVALGLAGCSENARVSTEPPDAAPPAISSAIVEAHPELPPPPAEAEPVASPEPEPEPVPEPPVDVTSIERRFLSASNDPAARIAAVRELVNATPAAALILLNRLFPVERREDVKSEMLATLSDLDRTKERDNQLALCMKALAPNQAQRIRYIAIVTLVDLRDPRARAILISLQSDPEREIRAAATRALGELAQ